MSAFFGICENVGFGVSVVAMNSYLPSLAKSSPEVVDLRAQLEAEEEYQCQQDGPDEIVSDNPDTPLIQHSQEPSKLKLRYESELSRATSRISSRGIAVSSVHTSSSTSV